MTLLTNLFIGIVLICIIFIVHYFIVKREVKILLGLSYLLSPIIVVGYFANTWLQQPIEISLKNLLLLAPVYAIGAIVLGFLMYLIMLVSLMIETVMVRKLMKQQNELLDKVEDNSNTSKEAAE